MATKYYIHVNGSAVNHQISKTTFSGATSNPAQAMFTMVVPYTYNWITQIPVIGQPVAIYLRDTTLKFAGQVSSVDWKGITETSTYIEVQISCVGYDDRLYRRTTYWRYSRYDSTGRTICARYRSYSGTVSVVGTTATYVSGHKLSKDLEGDWYWNGSAIVRAGGVVIVLGSGTAVVASVQSPDSMTLTSAPGDGTYTWSRTWKSGGVIKNLLDNYADGEGFIYDSSSIDDGVDITELAWDSPVTVAAAIQTVVDLNPGWFGSTDVNQKYWFKERNLVAAPTDLTDSTGYKRAIGMSKTKEDVRNSEVYTVTDAATSNRTYAITGDGVHTSWIVDYAIKSIVSVKLNSVDVGSVGNESDFGTTTYSYYFRQGEAEFWQDPSTPVMSSGDSLVIEYIRQYDNIHEEHDNAAIAARAAIEVTGTGRHEVVVDRTSLVGSVEALAATQASIDQLKDDILKGTVDTMDTTFEVGQCFTLQLTDRKLNELVFIEQIDASDADLQDNSQYDFVYTLHLVAAKSTIIPGRRTEVGMLREALGGKVVSHVGAVPLKAASGGGTPYTPPADAPNVITGTTAILDYNQIWNSVFLGLHGDIVLDTGHPNFSHEKKVQVWIYDPNGKGYGPLASFDSPTSSPITYLFNGTIIPQPEPGSSGVGTWRVKFIVENEDGVPTANPYYIDVSVVAAGVTSVSATERAGGRHQNSDTGCLTWVDITPVIDNAQLPMIVTTWLDHADGKGWVWNGWGTLVAVGQSIGVEVWLPTDPTMTGWKVAAAPGAINSTTTLPSSAKQYSFTVTTVGTCAVNDITGVAVSAYTTFENAVTGEKTYGFTISWVNTSNVADPAYFDTQFSVIEGTYVGGVFTPVSNELGSTPGDQAAGIIGRKFGNSSNPGVPCSIVITRWGFSGNVTRVYCWCVSRKGAGTLGTATQQTSAFPGGTPYLEFTPTATGLNLAKVDPTTIGSGLGQNATTKKLEVVYGSGVKDDGTGKVSIAYGSALIDDGTGKVTIDVVPTGPLYKTVSQQLNIHLTTDFIVDGSGYLSQNAVNLAKAYGFNAAEFTVAGGSFLVNAIGVNKLLANTALFTSTCTFANQTSGAAVQIAYAGITLADNYSSPVNTITVTALGATPGITIASGASNYVSIRSTGVYIYGPNGSLSATSSGIVITNGVITATSFSCITANSTVTISGVYAGVHCTWSSYVGIYDATQAVISNGSTYSSMAPGILRSTDGTNTSLVQPTSVSTSSVIIGSTTVINSSAQFVGNGTYHPYYGVTCSSVAASGGYTGGQFQGGGVYCPSYSVTCAGVSCTSLYSSGTASVAAVSCAGTCAAGSLSTTGSCSSYSLSVGGGGISYNGSAGSTVDITFRDSVGGYCTLNGSALRMSFKIGGFVGLI